MSMTYILGTADEENGFVKVGFGHVTGIAFLFYENRVFFGLFGIMWDRWIRGSSAVSLSFVSCFFKRS